MKKILVTGGAGYIGSHTVKELLEQNYKVVVLDNLSSGHIEAVDPRAEIEIGDFADTEAVSKIFKKHNPDAVIDFAASLSVGESMEEPLKYFNNNVRNFVNLLDIIAASKCNFIIKSSTAATYGNPIKDDDIPWKEDFTESYKPDKSALLSGVWDGRKTEGEDFFQNFIRYYQKFYKKRPELLFNEAEIKKLRIPMSIYGLTKLIDEIVLKKYNCLSGISSIALRYFNVCGADPSGKNGESKPKPTTLMTLAIYQILGKIPELQLFGNDYPTPDGTAIRDYIHPSDLAVGHIKSLEYLFGTKGVNIFNLGTGKGSSVLDVISSVEKASGEKVKILYKPRRSGDPTISIANPDKAIKLLGWKANYSLKQMAETAWRWHSSHPDGF